MRKTVLATIMAAVMLPMAPALADPPRHAPAHGWRDKQDRRWDDRRDRDGRWAESRYRDGRNYRERRLSASDRIYRGNDGRYYCERKDGTTGLIIGGLAGGVLGNVIAPGGTKTLGTILGGAGGAILGKSLDDGVRCR